MKVIFIININFDIEFKNEFKTIYYKKFINKLSLDGF